MTKTGATAERVSEAERHAKREERPQGHERRAGVLCLNIPHLAVPLDYA